MAALQSLREFVDHASEAETGIRAAGGVVVVMESLQDATAAREAGIANAVAQRGEIFTRDQADVLRRLASLTRIVYVLPDNGHGLHKARRALFMVGPFEPLMFGTVVERCGVFLPDGLSPAAFIEREGGEALQALIDAARPLVEMHIERCVAKADLTTMPGRAKALWEALSPLRRVADAPMAALYACEIAHQLGVSEAAAFSCLRSLREEWARG